MDQGGHHQQPQQGAGRGQGKGGGRGRGAPVRGRGICVRCSNEIRARVIDHVVNHERGWPKGSAKPEPSYQLHQLFVRSEMTMTLCWALQSMYRTVFHCICTLGNNHFYTFVKCVATIQCIL